MGARFTAYLIIGFLFLPTIGLGQDPRSCLTKVLLKVSSTSTQSGKLRMKRGEPMRLVWNGQDQEVHYVGAIQSNPSMDGSRGDRLVFLDPKLEILIHVPPSEVRLEMDTIDEATDALLIEHPMQAGDTCINHAFLNCVTQLMFEGVRTLQLKQ